MSEGGAVMSAVLVLGIIVLAANLISPNQAWDDFTAATRAIPTFNNPFDPEISRGEATVLGPTVLSANGLNAWVGCENTTEGRQSCVNTDDGSGTYFWSNRSGATGSTMMLFNWTDRNIGLLTYDQIVSIKWTMTCRSDSARPATFLLRWHGAMPDVNLTCPSGPTLRAVTWEENNGSFGSPTDAGSPYWNEAFITGPLFFSDPEDVSAQITFIGIQVVFAMGAVGGCQAPAGAWLPFLDEIACAIGRFGETIWKGLTFGFNGILFIGGIIVWVGGIFVAFLGLFGVIFNLGAPPFFQAFVDVLVITMLLFIAYTVAKSIRIMGSGI